MNSNQLPPARETDVVVIGSLQDYANARKAGREMNDLIALKVMGWQRHGGSWHAKGRWMAYADDVFREPAWSPCNKIADAWQVVEHLLSNWHIRPLQFRAEVASHWRYAKFVDCRTPVTVYGACELDMPLAICRAALKLVAQSDP